MAVLSVCDWPTPPCVMKASLCVASNSDPANARVIFQGLRAAARPYRELTSRKRRRDRSSDGFMECSLSIDLNLLLAFRRRLWRTAETRNSLTPRSMGPLGLRRRVHDD